MANLASSIDYFPSPRRVRVLFGGEVIARSDATLLVRNERGLPVYYFPLGDVTLAFLERSGHVDRFAGKGEATYWDVGAGGKSAKNAAWSFRDPLPAAEPIKGYVAFDWPRMDQWFEEDEEVFVHARDPYHRVDVLESHRPVRVVLGGEVLAETRSARFLFETSLPVRYYIPPEDVRMDLLEPSATVTRCPYKGTTGHYNARVGGEVAADVAWTYAQPIAECPRIKEYVCFYNERVEIFVDGAPIETVTTPWSRV